MRSDCYYWLLLAIGFGLASGARSSPVILAAAVVMLCIAGQFVLAGLIAEGLLRAVMSLNLDPRIRYENKSTLTGEAARNVVPPLTTPENPGRLGKPLPPNKQLVIGGVRIDNLSQDETVRWILDMINDGGHHYMAVVNASKLVLASKDDRLTRILNDADIVTADGMSVVWASRFLGRRLTERVTGIDTLERLLAKCAETVHSVYFLGGTSQSLLDAVRHFQSRYPDLTVTGWRDGYFSDDDIPAITADIKKRSADILFVGMGSPKQEIWISNHLRETGAKFALGVGGSFDHFSGVATRAPLWMQRSGLEWLHRLILEPRRLWRRYLFGNTAFAWMVVRQFISEKLLRSRPE